MSARAAKRTAGIGLLMAVAAAVLLAAGCARPHPQPPRAGDAVNLAHLEHLQERLEVEGTPVRIVHIYSEAPDYRWVGDEDEGIACVDDAARAVRLYMRRYRRTGDIALLEPAGEMLRFLLKMQAEDGEFYNFIRPGGTINRDHENSRKSFGWWTARGFRAIAEGAATLHFIEPELQTDVIAAGRRTIKRMRRHDPTGAGADPEMGYDNAAVLVLALCTWREALDDSAVDSLIERYVDWIQRGVLGPTDRFPYEVHASWRNLWHAWGQLQVEALARAGNLLGREDWVASARREAEGWQRELIARGGPVYFEFTGGDTARVRNYSQIAYDYNCLVQNNAALFEVTGDTAFALAAGLAASWFMGNNPPGTAMYDPSTGRCFDGINAPQEVNRNSGAESTTEALLAMEAVAGLPVPAGLVSARRVEGAVGDTARFALAGGGVVELRREGNRWTIIHREAE